MTQPIVVPESPPLIVTVQPPPQVVVVVEPSADLTIAAYQRGPKGDPGAPGSGAVQTTTAVASIALSGHRAVVQQFDGSFIYDDSTIANLRWLTPSITTGASAQGASATAVLFGYVSEPSWSWAAGIPIYLGPNGVLTQTLPSFSAGDTFQVQVGVAITATTILWAPCPPILLT